jgi:Uncharacterized protein conserved in bacteria
MMNIKITDRALEWFKKEVELQAGFGIRFFGKIYGNTQVHDGFSVGMSVDHPENPMFEETIDGLLFFAEETDDWFFKGLEMVVDFNEDLDEPKYLFTELA